MGLSNVLFAKDPALDAAEEELRNTERALEKEEDLVFTPHPDELKDLSIHAPMDVRRFVLINGRQKIYEARRKADQVRQNHKTNRNLIITLLCFALVIGRVYGLWDALGAFLKMFGAL